MKLRRASSEDCAMVKQIVHQTITNIYPHYYPVGAVEFFLDYHNKKNIETDIQRGDVYIVEINNISVATATINDDEIGRLFVLPDYQKQGIGSFLLEEMERIVWNSYNTIVIYASFPGYAMYLNRGYETIEYQIDNVTHDNKLCYFIMHKKRLLS